MATGLEDEVVAEKKRKYGVAKLDIEVLRIAKIVASYEQKTLADYLSDAMKAVVERDHQRHMRRAMGKGERPE